MKLEVGQTYTTREGNVVLAESTKMSVNIRPGAYLVLFSDKIYRFADGPDIGKPVWYGREGTRHDIVDYDRNSVPVLIPVLRSMESEQLQLF